MKLSIIKSFLLSILLLFAFAFVAPKAEANAPNVDGYVRIGGTNTGINGVWVKWTDKNGNIRYTQTRNDAWGNPGWYQFTSWQVIDRNNEFNTFVDTDLNGSAESRKASTTDYSAFGCFENPHTFTVVVPSGDNGTYETKQMSAENGNSINNDADIPNQQGPTIYYTPPVTIQGRITSSSNGAALSGVTITVANNNNQSRSASTDGNGNFSVAGFVSNGGVYAVRPGGPPAGYQSPSKTTKTSWSYRICAGSDTPANQSSYECQQAGNNDCANGTGGYCNFVYDPIPPTPTPIPGGPISGLTSACLNPGNRVTLSWTASNYQKYAIRVDDDVSDASSATVDPATANECTPHDICLNNWTGTSITLNVNATRTYRWWIHGIKYDGNWTNALYGTAFRCAPDCLGLNGPSTIVQGQKGNYVSTFESKVGNTAGDIVWGQNGGGLSSLADWSDGYPEKSPNYPVDKSFNTGFTWNTSGVTPGTYQLFCRGFNDYISECRANSSYFTGAPNSAYRCSSVDSGGGTMNVNIVAPTPTPTPVPKCDIRIRHVRMPDKTDFVNPPRGATVDYNALQAPPITRFTFSGVPSGQHQISLGSPPPSDYTVSFSNCVNTTDDAATGCHANVSGTDVYSLISTCPANGYQDYWFHWYPKAPVIRGLSGASKESPSRTGNVRTSGLRPQEGGANWLNPLIVTLDADGVTNTNTMYFVAFYDKNGGQVTSASTVNDFDSAIRRRLNSDPAAGFLLRYDKSASASGAITHYVYNPNTQSYQNIGGLTTQGFLITKNGTPIYRVRPGIGLQWIVDFLPAFGIRSMYTTAFVESTLTDGTKSKAFSPELSP